MHILLKEALKESVKYPWHTIVLTSNGQDGITYCVKNSLGTQLFSVTKLPRFDRIKRRPFSDYCMTIYSNPVVSLSGENEKVDIEGIFHACETRMSNPTINQLTPALKFDATIKFLKQNMK